MPEVSGKWRPEVSRKRGQCKAGHLALAMILALALSVRLWGIDFGLPDLYHWDEALAFFNAFYALNASLRIVTQEHGSLFPYLISLTWACLHIILRLLGQMNSLRDLMPWYFSQPYLLFILPRIVIALFSTATVLLTYLLGKQAYDEKIGIVGAGFLSLTFLHVTHAHYAVAHELAAFLITASVYCSVRLIGDTRTKWYVGAALLAGLGAAARFYAFLCLAPLCVAHLLIQPRPISCREAMSLLLDRRLLLSLDVALLAFFMVTPYGILDSRVFFGQMKWFASNAAMRTWVDTGGLPVWLFYLTEHLRGGMGLPLELLAFAGFGYCLVVRKPEDIILSSFLAAHYLLLAMGPNFARYALPLLPFLALVAARALVDFIHKSIGQPTLQAAATLISVVVVLTPSTMSVVRFDYLLTQKDTRTVAKHWINNNIPAGSLIASEGTGNLGTASLGPGLSMHPSSIRHYLSYQVYDPEGAGYLANVLRASEHVRRRYLECMLSASKDNEGFDVVSLASRLESPGISGLPQVVESARSYSELGFDYLITTSWVRRTDAEQMSPKFEQSLETYYDPVAEFAPTVVFPFDPLCWKVDYRSLAQVNPFKPVLWGPIIRVYALRDLTQE